MLRYAAVKALAALIFLLLVVAVKPAFGQVKYRPEGVLGVDFRLSWAATTVVDISQTTRFKKLGISEANPLADGALHFGNTAFVVGAAASIYVIDRFIQQQDPANRKFFYVLMWCVEKWAVTNNRNLGVSGRAILFPAIKFK
jgi:hypothetical protein